MWNHFLIIICAFLICLLPAVLVFLVLPKFFLNIGYYAGIILAASSGQKGLISCSKYASLILYWAHKFSSMYKQAHVCSYLKQSRKFSRQMLFVLTAIVEMQGLTSSLAWSPEASKNQVVSVSIVHSVVCGRVESCIFF